VSEESAKERKGTRCQLLLRGGLHMVENGRPVNQKNISLGERVGNRGDAIRGEKVKEAA